jgi:K+-transporting ATPase ATPase C chain
MFAHIRACLWLLVLTVLLCSVVYPLSLWVIGQTVFPHQANGSLVDKDGNPTTSDKDAVGSWLIAQEFKGDEYFQSRPSAASYNGAASGATNYGANNYLLRDKVARSLAPLAKYDGGPKDGQLVAPTIVAWFRLPAVLRSAPVQLVAPIIVASFPKEKSGLVADWATAHSGLAQTWVKSDEVAGKFVKDWFAATGKPSRAVALAKWRGENPKIQNPNPEDLAVPFFVTFAEEYPGTWLAINEKKDAKGEGVKNAKGEAVKQVDLIQYADEDSGDIAAVFFDIWRQEHPNVALKDVPADLVTASGSGLDPHITLKGAMYQLDRVAPLWEKPGLNQDEVRAAIKKLLTERASAPLFGLAGVQMVNVLEINIALTKELKLQKKQSK